MDKDEGKCSFPVGMRILAVDDDQQYLQALKEMLIQCQYQVTTTTEPNKALEMLRENRNKFDLVIISDANMADMDGFQLLQLVRREMDLPVIMYSDHGDTDMVKKGVLHGACQYLVKPIRTEEMQNIWQHVLRRQINLKNKASEEVEMMACIMAGEGGSQGIVASSSSEEESKDLSSSTTKKPRFDWTLERHQIFVAAVNQQGLQKAVPKKILALMKDSVEGLTREIVASHLQKHRQHVRRTAEKQAANRIAALSGSGPCHQQQQHTASLDPCAYGSGRFSSSTGILSRMNSSPSALNLRGMSSSCSSLGLPQKQVVGGSNHPYMFCAADQSSHGIPTPTNKLNHHQFQQSNNAATGGSMIRQSSSSIDHPNNSSGFAVVPSVCTNSTRPFNNVGAIPLATHYPDKFYSDARLMDQSSDFGSSDDVLLYLINSSEPTKWDAIDGMWRN